MRFAGLFGADDPTAMNSDAIAPDKIHVIFIAGGAVCDAAGADLFPVNDN